MTYKDFLKQLRKLRGKFEFVNRGAGIRLRAYGLNDGGARTCLCPIEAVAASLGEQEPTYSDSLNLAPTVRDSIVGMSDGRTPHTGRDRITQRDMLRVLGLTKPDSWA